MRTLIIAMGLSFLLLTVTGIQGFAENVEVTSEWGYYLSRGNYGIYAGTNTPQDQVQGYVFIGPSNPMYKRFGGLRDSMSGAGINYDVIWGPKIQGGRTDPYGQHYYRITPNQIRNAATGAPINGVIYVQPRRDRTGAGGFRN
jgi:hypothetical protein